MNTILRQIPFDAASDAAAAGGGGAGGGDAAAQAAAAAASKAAAGGAGGGDAAAQAAAAAAAKPKPFYDGLYGADGKLDKTAFDRLPDHLKPHKDWIGKYDTIEALIAGGANAHALGVKKALVPLIGNEPPEVVAERKAHLDQINGVPKDPKGYAIVRPETLPEQFWNQEGADKFALLAQKHSISPGAVKELLALQLDLTQGEIDRGKAYETDYYAKQDQAYEAGLKKLGMDADKAKDMAERGATTLGIDPKDPIMKSASVRLAAIRMTALVSESKLITGGDPSKATGDDPRAQAVDIMNNPANPMHKAWNDPNDPRHEAAKDKVNALYQQHGERQRKQGGL